jgi:cobalt-precorrin-5B (C1)-methyltransferase
VLHLLAGWRGGAVDVPLPAGSPGRLSVPVAWVRAEAGGARAGVVKDGGDDPDVTSGLVIEALVRLDHGPDIEVEGGRGVGRATLPGLPVAVGRAAINPEPLAQIAAAVREGLAEAGSAAGARVLVEVPDGERAARATMNPRLGILGGISILGRTGIVRPFSHASYTASIAEALDVARAAGLDEVVFTTGRRSDRFVQALRPDLPAQAVVQAADFFGFANREAARRGFRAIGWSVLVGKLVKQAQGLDSTHAGDADVDFGRLAGLCGRAGLDPDRCREVAEARLARQVLAILADSPRRPAILALLAAEAAAQARRMAGPGPLVRYYLFDFEGNCMTTHEAPGAGAGS